MFQIERNNMHVTHKGHLLLDSCRKYFPSSWLKIRAENGEGAQWGVHIWSLRHEGRELRLQGLI